MGPKIRLTTKDDDYPIIYRVLTIPGGAGFRLSTVAMENGPGLKMYFVLNMGIFQPAMSVYQRVTGAKYNPYKWRYRPILTTVHVYLPTFR